MDEDKLEFVIAAKFNKKFRKLLKNHKMENGNTSNVFEYKFKCRRSTFNILAILNQDKPVFRSHQLPHNLFYQF